MGRKAATWERRLYFPSKGRHGDVPLNKAFLRSECGTATQHMSEYDCIYPHKKMKTFNLPVSTKLNKFSTKFCADLLYRILPTTGNK
jgi:hypothetical protein